MTGFLARSGTTEVGHVLLQIDPNTITTLDPVMGRREFVLEPGPLSSALAGPVLDIDIQPELGVLERVVICDRGKHCCAIPLSSTRRSHAQLERPGRAIVRVLGQVP
nr:hypothetical protein [Nocardia blacklockiae]